MVILFIPIPWRVKLNHRKPNSLTTRYSTLIIPPTTFELNDVRDMVLEATQPCFRPRYPGPKASSFLSPVGPLGANSLLGIVQPDSSKTLSKWFSGVVPLRLATRRRCSVRTGNVVRVSGAFGESLTSGFKDHLKGLEPWRLPQLERFGQVLMGSNFAE